MLNSILRRPEDRILLAHQIATYALYAVLFVLFAQVPWWGKALCFFVGAMLAQRYEGGLHYSTHTPIFRSKRLNHLHRLSWSLFPLPAILYRAEHFHHHRYNNKLEDLTTTLDPTGKSHVTVWEYALSSLVDRKFKQFYSRLSPRERRECLLGFGLYVALTATLCALDPFTGLVFWLPLTAIVAPLIMDVHCYLDHVPGNPYDEFHLATYFNVRTRWHRFCSLVDLNNSAYHLTHHRFPGVHWSELPRVQAEWLDEYQQRGSPESFAFGKTMMLNPIAFFWIVWRANAARHDMQIDAPLRPSNHIHDTAVDCVTGSEGDAVLS
jgi:fatty acid desaturase